MSTAAFVTVEEYLRRTEKPNCEYVDGVLYPKARPTSFHALIQYVLLTFLHKQGAQALPELTLPVRRGKFLVPDVVVVRKVEQPYPAEPSLLCIEILSPEIVQARCSQNASNTMTGAFRTAGWLIPRSVSRGSTIRAENRSLSAMRCTLAN
jgi:Uma2 family endonuclease